MRLKGTRNGDICIMVIFGIEAVQYLQLSVYLHNYIYIYVYTYSYHAQLLTDATCLFSSSLYVFEVRAQLPHSSSMKSAAGASSEVRNDVQLGVTVVRTRVFVRQVYISVTINMTCIYTYLVISLVKLYIYVCKSLAQFLLKPKVKLRLMQVCRTCRTLLNTCNIMSQYSNMLSNVEIC